MEFDYPLPERWKWVPLGELADTKGRAIVSGPFGSNISSRFFVEQGIPVIRGNNLTTGSEKFVDGGFVFVTPEKAKELGNVDAVPDDIIFTAAGSLGQVGIIPEQTRFPLYIISNKQMRVRLNRDLIDPLFAFQWLSSSGMVAHIQRQNTGSSVPLINLSIVRRLPVPLPPLAEQKAIAAVLGALDDKIELNRRMNATLEAMARALFQSWFVDFDPVRAKLDGREPIGLDAATAALFPEHLEDSPLGHIPLGWDVCNLSSHTKYLSRGIGPAYIEEGGICVLNQKCVREHRVDFFRSRRHDFSKKSADGKTLQPFDVLVNSTGMGTLGRVAQVFHLPEPTIVDSHVTIVRAASGTDPFFLGVDLTGREAEIEELGEGSTGQTELSRTRLGELKIITPPFEIQQAFGTAVRPLLQRISENEKQSRTLATLRDTLLPKLLSGDLSVPVARIETGVTV